MMRRNILLIWGMILAISVLIGCSSDDPATDIETANDESEITSEEAETEESESNSADASSLGIELRDHNFDPDEEDIEDDHEGPNYYIKTGNYLTLPEELPEHFPIPEGMTATSVKVNTKSAEDDEFYSLEIWFSDNNNYSLDELNQLYTHYLEENFEDVEIKDYSQYKDDLTVYSGYRDDLEFYIDTSPEPDFNIVTISIYTE